MRLLINAEMLRHEWFITLVEPVHISLWVTVVLSVSLQSSSTSSGLFSQWDSPAEKHPSLTPKPSLSYLSESTTLTLHGFLWCTAPDICLALKKKKLHLELVTATTVAAAASAGPHSRVQDKTQHAFHCTMFINKEAATAHLQLLHNNTAFQNRI